jgi:hypothetical protein
MAAVAVEIELPPLDRDDHAAEVVSVAADQRAGSSAAARRPLPTLGPTVPALELELPPHGQQDVTDLSSEDEPEAAETDTLLPSSTADSPRAKPMARARAALPRIVQRKGPPRRADAKACGCSRALARYTAAAEDEPFRTSSLTCAVLLGASDLTEQLLVERRSWSAFDPGVVLAVVIYGVVYNGPMNVIIYRLYEKTYREESMGRFCAVVAKVSTDQFVSSPFVYTPGYYVVTGLVRLHSPSEIWTTLKDAWFPSVITQAIR